MPARVSHACDAIGNKHRERALRLQDMYMDLPQDWDEIDPRRIHRSFILWHTYFLRRAHARDVLSFNDQGLIWLRRLAGDIYDGDVLQDKRLCDWWAIGSERE